MKLSITVPDAYGEAIAGELVRRGHDPSPAEVRRVLRYCIPHTTEKHWWKKRGVWMWWRGDPTDVTPYRESERAPFPAIQISIDEEETSQ